MAKALSYETVKLSSLKPHPSNYRGHGPDQLEHIKASIKQHGIYKNVVIAKDSTILAGHGVVAACKELGVKDIQIARLNIAPDDTRALKILTGDNEISKLGEVDDRALSEILRHIAVDNEGLLGTGFDKEQLANLVYVTRHENEIKDFNAAREWVGLPGYDDEDPSKGSEPVIVISFLTKEDRDKYVEKTGLKIRDKRGDRKWSTIWPYQERNDLKSVKFEAEK